MRVSRRRSQSPVKRALSPRPFPRSRMMGPTTAPNRERYRLAGGDKMDKLRVAIAGCHRMLDTANRGHNWANGFARAPDTTVVAVFDKDQATRERFRAVWRDTWGEMPAYGDYDRMLAETAPDIVCIATRQTMHADQIETAANAGVRGIACGEASRDQPGGDRPDSLSMHREAGRPGVSTGPAVVRLLSGHPRLPARRHRRRGHRRHRLRRPEPHQPRLPLVRYRPRAGRRRRARVDQRPCRGRERRRT